MASATTDRRLGLAGNTAYKVPVTVVATANIIQSGEQTIDTVAVKAINAAGVADRVLCVGMTDATKNGFWDVSTAAWTRSIDANGNYDLAQGTQAIVTRGTLANQIWMLTTANPITIGTTALAFSQSLSAGFLATLLAAGGAALIGFIQAGAGAVLQTVQAALRERVSVKQFGAVGDGATDDTAAIRDAIVYASGTGGAVYLPRGSYLVTSAILVYDNVTIYGDGFGSRILVNTDIEVFYSATTTVNTAVFGVEFKNFFIQKTVTGATTKYDIHLQNPSFCKFKNVRIQSGHIDSAYSATNVGGVFLDKPAGSTAAAYCNSLVDCFMQNNSLYFLNVTDSYVRGGYYWGHVREFAIRIKGGGNIQIDDIDGLISSQYKGGIWIDGSSVNQLRISGNEHDGNPLLTLGWFIYCPQTTTSVIVTGNTVWGAGKHGIEVADPVGWVCTGNHFWKGNVQDNFYDDIRITGVAFQPNGNNFSSNGFTIDAARTNKGYAIREVNGGNNPTQNVYNNNTIVGATAYQTPGILVLLAASVLGNTGQGTDDISNALGVAFQFGGANGSPGGLVANNSGTINASGTLDLTVNTTSFGGSPGGFSGILTVTSTRINAPTQSRRTVYACVGYGTTATFTSLATQDGSGGGSAFTVTMTSNGVIRFTDTSAQQVGVRIAFLGSKSLA